MLLGIDLDACDTAWVYSGNWQFPFLVGGLKHVSGPVLTLKKQSTDPIWSNESKSKSRLFTQPERLKERA